MAGGKKPFKGIKLHHIFSIELSSLHKDDIVEYSEKMYWPTKETSKTYHASYMKDYLGNKAQLEKICNHMSEDDYFVDPHIIHSSSDLGMPYKIVSKTNDDKEIFFDGLYLRITELVTDEELDTQDILSKTKCPRMGDPAIDKVMAHVVKEIKQLSVYSGTYQQYYTITNTNWDVLGLKRTGQTLAQGMLNLTDNNIVTITAIVFAKIGKDYQVYFGEEHQIHQMISNDYAILQEVRIRDIYLEKKIDSLINSNKEMTICYEGTTLPIWKILEKRRRWKKIKKIVIDQHLMEDVVEKAVTYYDALAFIKTAEKAFINVPQQIAIGGEPDVEIGEQWPTRQFVWFDIVGDKLKIKDTKVDPICDHAVNEYKVNLDRLIPLKENIYRNAKDLVSEYQTDFTIEALLFAIGALLVSVASIFISILIS